MRFLHAGVRIDPDLNAGSRMGYKIGETEACNCELPMQNSQETSSDLTVKQERVRVVHDLAEMALVDFTESLVLPAPREQETRIHGYPENSHLNFVSWSDDSKYIAFTVRSPGESMRCLQQDRPGFLFTALLKDIHV